MNIPNRLTILRVIMIPVFIIFLMLDINNGRIIATIIFIVASLTDWLDGFIARKYDLVSNFGKFADPLADKILVCAALICLVELGDIPAWIVVVIIAREFAVSGLRIIAASEQIVIAASWWGKIKTVTQMIAIITTLFNSYQLNIIGVPVNLLFLYLAALFTIISGIDYFIINKQVFINKDY